MNFQSINVGRSPVAMNNKELYETAFSLIASKSGIIAIVTEMLSRNDAKQCRMLFTSVLTIQDSTFKTSDKTHNLYNVYDAFCTQLRAIDKTGKTATNKPKSIETMMKTIATWIESNPELETAIKAAYCKED